MTKRTQWGSGGFRKTGLSLQPILFVDLVVAVGLEVLQDGGLPRGPGNRDRVGLLQVAQAEGQWQLDGRKVTQDREELAVLGEVTDLDRDLGPDGLSVGGASGQLEADPVVLVAALVAEEAGRSAVDGQDDVEVAVAVDVGVSAAAADDRP